MLVLTAKVGQKIWIGDGHIVVLARFSNQIRLGFVFNNSVYIERDAIKIRREREEAARCLES